jgi:hypothetical protein
MDPVSKLSAKVADAHASVQLTTLTGASATFTGPPMPSMKLLDASALHVSYGAREVRTARANDFLGRGSLLERHHASARDLVHVRVIHDAPAQHALRRRGERARV